MLGCGPFIEEESSVGQKLSDERVCFRLGCVELLASHDVFRQEFEDYYGVLARECLHIKLLLVLPAAEGVAYVGPGVSVTVGHAGAVVQELVEFGVDQLGNVKSTDGRAEGLGNQTLLSGVFRIERYCIQGVRTGKVCERRSLCK